MNRIDSKFQELKAAKKKGLVIFITAGAPDIEATIAAVKMAEANGADAIELGIPFSDPMADGPIIQVFLRGHQEGHDCKKAYCSRKGNSHLYQHPHSCYGLS